jgi:hypothetical protein
MGYSCQMSVRGTYRVKSAVPYMQHPGRNANWPLSLLRVRVVEFVKAYAL